MQRIFKWLLLSILVIAVAGLGYVFFAPQPVSVDLATIDYGTIETTIDEEGETRVRDIYRISAPITGKLERLDIEVGDEVTTGQRIARIRPVDPPIRDIRSRLELAAAEKAATAAVTLAQAQIRQAASDLDFAEKEFRRARTLAQKGVVPTRNREEAELQVNVKKAELRKTEANLELRRRELESARMARLEPNQIQRQIVQDQCCMAVTAPANGVVLKVQTESEQVVQSGTTILEVGDPHNLEIIVDLLSTDAVAIPSNATAYIEDWGGAGPLKAKVRRIDPAGFTKISALGIEEQRVFAVLDFTTPPEQWRNLGHAFKVTVRILRSNKTNVLRVPLSALFRRGETWLTYVVRDGSAHTTELKLGSFSLSHAEVIDGLQEGEQVIEFPSDQIENGVAVEQREVSQ